MYNDDTSKLINSSSPSSWISFSVSEIRFVNALILHSLLLGVRSYSTGYRTDPAV